MQHVVLLPCQDTDRRLFSEGFFTEPDAPAETGHPHSRKTKRTKKNVIPIDVTHRSGAHEAEDGGRGVDASATAGLMRGTERKAEAVGAPPGLLQQAACRTA